MLDNRERLQKIRTSGIDREKDGQPLPAGERAPRLPDQLYAQLMDHIVSGALPRGRRLPSENRLSADFGVSRPVIREAIARLKADGVVFTRHGAGTFVAAKPKTNFIGLSPIAGIDDLMTCIEFRAALECETAGLAAKRWAGPSLHAIEAALAAIAGEGDGNPCFGQAVLRFHLAIARASQNALLEAALTALLGHIAAGLDLLPQAQAGLARQCQIIVRGEHRAIADAIRARDESQACTTMRLHLENARIRILEEIVRP